ncbi:HpcH/HpaI aldolase/citrate lyase family protein [Herbaspirillum huttiense]|jgi:citrate lyase subunit beta/citryl-CoA lyase|uniref:CoA ester lyase n=2 Tax=Herbaspirillum huttiense TaxID=863372 RepID=A0AAJ2H4D0_9BURK|nr:MULTISPECIES: CoA ester lyase [Herbaspirillum]MBN9355496.1 CoA ester lyase [Herbaspirillum huttiense]MCP3654136.1 CoA ester lyase [Herbaspirillum sp.]MCP3949209.1 CoA ester lyase [Herbaspirillum sp.]MCP4034685.1 CoA ester lyase [Herbaspirillum sp.]MCP4557049.1 CoA ester lyase [Herbaspirillum sp.]
MAPHITTASSYLFVPANRPERYAKALESGADAVIVDLEDAVALPQKEEARATLARWLRGNGPQPRLWVRINAADTVWHGDDLLTFSALSMAGIVLPKAEEAKTLSSIARRLGPGRGLIALIESAAGLAAMREIAAVPGVQRLAFGSIDAQVDLGMQCGPEEEELMHFRMEMVMASRLAGIAPPIDGVTTDFNDDAFLARMVQRARRMGFGAKLCIHPKQVEGVRRGFMPGEQELAWAEEVMAAVRASDGGAISLKGKMIDKPVILQAEKFLHQAGRLVD